MDAKALYVQLGRLIETMPDLYAFAGPETLKWLGRASALVEASGDIPDSVSFKVAMDKTVGEQNGMLQDQAVSTVTSILYRQLAKAEMKAPADAQGAFIAAGNSLDALAAVAKVFGQAKSSLLIVDPYMDEKALIDFALMAAENVAIRLLSDQQGYRPGLKPASERWRAQYDSSRPLEVRLASARTLHDRLILVDDSSVWILTQSLNALAARSPASIVRVEDDAASLKLEAYKAIWNTAAKL